jgi:hypothetical protein
MVRDREIEIKFIAGRRQFTFKTTLSQIERTGFTNEVERFITDGGLGPIAKNIAKNVIQLVERKVEVTLKEQSEIELEGKKPRGVLDVIPPGTDLSSLAGAFEEHRSRVFILVVIVSDTATDPGTSYGHTVRLYRDLLKNKYPEAIVETTGCTLRNLREEWLTQGEFESYIRSAYESAKGKYEPFLGFDQVHIVGHGVPGLGLQFKDGSGFDPDYLEEGTTANNLMQLAPGGKVVIAACSAKDGRLVNWLRAGFGEDIEAEDIEEKSRVHAVEGDFIVEKKRGKPEWDLHESTKEIENFLGRKLEK